MTELEYRLQLLKSSVTPTIDRTPQYDIEDADTINGARIDGYDAPETRHSGVENAKAQKIQDQYGASLESQYTLGDQATTRAQELLQDPRYQQFEQTGELGHYGRSIETNPALQETLIEEGLATPTNRYDEKMNTLFRNANLKREKLGYTEDATTMDQVRDYNIESDYATKDAGFGSSVGRSVDALQSGTVSTAGKLVDLASDLVGYTIDQKGISKASSYLDKFGETMATSEYADKVAGYDRQESNFKKAEIGYKWEKGDYVGAILDGAVIAPETLAESLPMMFEMMVGFSGKAKVVGKVGNFFKKNAGFAAVVGQETNAQAEEYEALYGEKVSIDKLAAMTATSTLMLGLDRLAFKDILGMKTGLKKMVDVMPAQSGNKLIDALSIPLVIGFKTAQAGGKEAAQEYTQTWGEILNTHLEGNGQTISDILNNKEYQKEAVVGAIVGMGAGGLTGTPSAIDSVVRQPLTDRLAKKNEGKVKAHADTKLAEDAEPIVTTEETVTEPVTATEPTVDEVVAKMQTSNADTVFTPEEEQVQANNKKEIETKLQEALKIEDEIEVQVQEYEKALLNSGKPVEEVIKQVKELRDSIDAAGIAPEISTEARKQGLSIEPLESTITTKGSKKAQTFDAFKAGTRAISKILKGTFTVNDMKAIIGEDNTDSNLGERLTKHFTSGSKVQKTLETVSKELEGKGQAELEAINATDASPERAMKIASIVVSNIFKGQASEKDVQAKQGVELKEEYVRESAILAQIGKEYVNSYGLQFKGDNTITDVEYAKIGQKMLAYTQATGLISSEARNVPTTRMVDKEGNALYDAKDLSAVGIKSTTGKKGSTKGKNVNQENTYTVSESIKDLGYSLDVLARVFRPTNTELPTTEVTEFVPVDQEISPVHMQLLKDYNKLQYKLKPGALELLQELKKMSESYEDMDTFFKSNKQVRQLLGSKPNKLWLRKKSDEGKKLNREVALKKILNNLEALPADFHYNYESAINTRIHVMQTILEYQGDKYISRQLITGNEKQVTDSKQSADVLIENVAEEIGLSIEEVITPTGRVKGFLDTMTKNDGKIPVEDAILYAKELGLDSPFKAMSLMSAMHDIYIATDKSKITTDYMVEFDMTASGVVNTLMNLSGTKEVQPVLDEMLGGIDPYKYLQNFIETTGTDTAKDVQVVVDKLASIGFNRRNLAKSPIMTWFYGSMDDNVAKNMGHDTAVDLVTKAIGNNPDAVTYINEILGNTEYTNEDIGSISQTDMGNLDLFFTENLGQAYVNALPKAFPGVSQYRNKMTAIFKVLQATGKWDGKIETAMSKLDGSENTQKMSVRKKKGTPQEVDEGVYILINKYFNNENSFNVNLQHSADAAQLLLTLQEYMKSGTTEGVMSVHDALYGHANKMLDMKTTYEGKLKDTAINYDFLQAAIDEAQTAIDAMEDVDRRNARQIELDAVKVGHDDQITTKAEYLEDKETNFFGTKTIKPGEVVPETKTEEVVTETKAESKSGYIGVVFNTYGKVYDYKVDNIDDYKVGDVVDSFDVTFTVKNILADKDYIPKEGMGYKNITKITKEEVDKLAPQSMLNNINAKPNEDISEAIAAEVEQLEVSEEYKDIQAKVVAALKGEVKALAGTEWSGIFGTINVDLDTNGITNDALISILGHEIDHAIQYGYILDNMDKAEVKFLGKVVDRISNAIENGVSTKIEDKIWDRLDYIVSPFGENVTNKYLKERQITELMSILRNEPAVLESLVEAKVIPRTVIQKIADAIKAAYAWATNNTSKAVEQFTEVNLENTLNAMEVLDANAKVDPKGIHDTRGKNVKPAGISKAQRDMYEEAAKNPLKYAHGIIARQNVYVASMLDALGVVGEKLLNPLITKIDDKGQQYGVYRDAIRLIRAGFKDSELAQKMRETLQIGVDIDDTIMQDLLQTASDIQQRSADYLTKNLPDLDNRVNKLYTSKEDRVKVYETFARSGISGLQHNSEIVQGLIHGDMTIDEALVIATEGIDAQQVLDAQNLAKYYVTGDMIDGMTNTNDMELFSPIHKTIVALEAIKLIDNGKILSEMNPALKIELYALSVTVEALNNEINEHQASYDGTYHTKTPVHQSRYDGHYMMDIHEGIYEYKMVNIATLKTSKYGKDNDWVVIKEPTKNVLGIVARKSLSAANTPGVGLNNDRFSNGFVLTEEDNIKINNILSNIKSESARQDYMNENKLTKSGSGFRITIDNKTKADKLEMKQSVAHSLYRTLQHNSELIEMQSVRDIITDVATEKMDKVSVDKLNETLGANRLKALDDKDVVPMFIKLDYDYESFDKLPKWVQKYYKTPENISNYNGLSKSITLVKRGQADVLTGHKNLNLFDADGQRNLAKLEVGFKQLVVMAKQHMVVANASKLTVDMISNLGLLSAKDVSLLEMKEYIPEAFKLYSDFSKKRSEIVELELRARMGDKSAINKLKIAKENLTKHKFYPAFKAGFVQSYSTNLVVKDFDTVSGLQKSIDDIVESLTKDEKGNPNEIYDAIKWWQKLGDKKGVGVDHLIRWASDISKIKGTTVSEEMKHLADRLKAKKDVDSVARYVGDIVGSPASEAVTIGGAVMVTADVVSKYTLAKSLLDRTNPITHEKYTIQEAYLEANNTFIDYRRNMPSEIKMLSDYGVLLFPSFWLKAQKVIANLVHRHPLTAVSTYSIEAYMGIGGANFLDVNIANKIMEGRIINSPTSIIDWNVVSPWI